MGVLSLALAIVLLRVLAFFTSLWVRGKLTLDLDWGRSVHPLGPSVVEIAAPREMVFQLISGPYLGRTPRAMGDQLEVIESGEDWALAAHYTEFTLYTAETVELVHFESPDLISFYHVRGPVPYAAETFELAAIDERTTELTYSGEVGIDFWRLRSVLAGVWVVPAWESEVGSSLDGIKETAEERMRRRARRNMDEDDERETATGLARRCWLGSPSSRRGREAAAPVPYAPRRRKRVAVSGSDSIEHDSTTDPTMGA